MLSSANREDPLDVLYVVDDFASFLLSSDATFQRATREEWVADKGGLLCDEFYEVIEAWLPQFVCADLEPQFVCADLEHPRVHLFGDM